MAEAISTGLVTSLLLSELVGLSAGGLITPAYLALLVDQPWRLAGTALVALLAFAGYRLLSRYLILFGRRRFLAMVLLGVTAKWLVEAAAPAFAATLFASVGAIGYVIPGLIANDFERQGILPTIAMVSAATVLAALVVRVAGFR
jgi:poly-gamma-glutamate biosynthesis protein PgsC/CapC